ALYAAPPASPVTRLRNPVGYWNVLALLGDAALPLALWIAAPRRRPVALRILGVLLFYVAAVAVLLTYSRTGVVVGGLAVLAWVLLAPDRLESLAATGLAAAPALGVCVFAFTRAGLKHFEPYSARVHDGAWFGFVLVAGAVAVVVGAVAAARWEDDRPLDGERRRLFERRAAFGLLAAVVVAVGGVAWRAGGAGAWWRACTAPGRAVGGRRAVPRRVGDADRVAALAVALGAGVCLAHALFDYDWEFVAATGPVLVVGRVLVASGRPGAPARRRWAPAGLAVAAVLAA